MNIEKKYKEHILKNLTPTDKSDELINKLNLNNAPKKKNMKKGLVFATGGLALAVVIGVGTYVVINNHNNNNQSTQAPSVVTLSVNPSIRFVLDKDNKVAAVTGENDEGKMIVAGEEIVGQPIDKAIELVLRVENETGYLVSGNVTSDENNIRVSIMVDNEAVEDALKDSISNSVSLVCDELNVDAHMEYVEASKAYNKEKLQEIALKCDPTLSEEEVKEMSYEQLINVIKVYGLETAELYSTDLENFYNEAKAYKLSFAEQKFTKDVIANMSVIYGVFMESYQTVLDNLQSEIEKLNELNYNHFVSEESQYQIALGELAKAKADLISLKNQLAQSDTEDTEAKTQLQEAIDTQISLLEAKEEALASIRTISESFTNHAKSMIETALEAAENFKNTLVAPDSIEKELNNKAIELQTTLNEAKDAMFTEFENTYKDDILAAKEEVLAYKQALKDSIKNQNNNNQ